MNMKCEKHNELKTLEFAVFPGGSLSAGWYCRSCEKEKQPGDPISGKKIKSIYLIGSLRNPKILELGNELRQEGFEVFNDWMAAGPEADDYWQKYEQDRGRTYDQALKGYAAQNVYKFDKLHLDRCDAGVLVLPAGKSGHLELGYLIGKEKPGFILMDKTPDRWDVMYNFASGVYFDRTSLFESLREA